MWKLFNILFGWQYVYVTNTAACKVTRVKQAPNGAYYFQPYSFQMNFVPSTLPRAGEHVNGWLVQPLTRQITDQLPFNWRENTKDNIDE